MFRIITEDFNDGIFGDCLSAVGLSGRVIDVSRDEYKDEGIKEILEREFARNRRVKIVGFDKNGDEQSRWRFPILLWNNAVISCGHPLDPDRGKTSSDLRRLLRMYKED